MTKYKLEYIWLDGKKPVPDLRGKTLIKSFEKPPTLADLPNWGFDGSSTMQAEGKSSDCVLKPVALYPDASRKDAYIVLSEVITPTAPRIPPTRALRSRTTRTCGLVLSRNTSSTRMGVLSASRKTATRVLPGPVLLRRRLQVHGQPGP